MSNVRDVLKAIGAGINHSKTSLINLGDTWGPREEVIAQLAAAHTASILTKETDAELAFLRFYKKQVYPCLGPADGEIERMIKDEWVKLGNTLPPGYEIEE